MQIKTSHFALVFLTLAAGTLQALINPNFTPVDLIRQTTAVWEARVVADEDDLILNVTTTDVLRGESLAAEFTLDYKDAPHLEIDLRAALDPEGRGPAFFLTGDFSGASMGGDVEVTPKAMMKLGIRWYMIADAGENRLVIREDPIDLSTVWAGDVRNLRQVTEYVIRDPRATVPVASGARWESETKVADIGSPVSRMETVLLAENPLVFLYSIEGDEVYAWRDGELRSLDGALGINSASAHAVWGRFAPGPIPSMMSMDAEGALTLWHRIDEEFHAKPIPVTQPGTTGLATIALPERAGLLLGTAEGMREVVFQDGEWKRLEHASPEEAGPGGPVFSVDLTGDGHPERFQAHENGLVIIHGGETSFLPYPSVGTALGLTVADFVGDGMLDILITGTRGSALLVQTGPFEFQQRLETTGELSYNIRPGVNHIGLGDHALDGRVDLVLFNQALPPQIYFNRGFAVFGYDMELDLQEDAIDTLDAAGMGQQAGLLADLTGDGLQELLLLTSEGELWLLQRQTEGITPLTAELRLPATVTGPVPVVVRDGDRVLGARISAPHAPAFIGRRNRGPVDVTWRKGPGHEPHTQRVIVLRPGAHELRGE